MMNVGYKKSSVRMTNRCYAVRANFVVGGEFSQNLCLRNMFECFKLVRISCPWLL